MGVVKLPASVPAGGKLGAYLELDRDELAETVARLKSAVQALTNSGATRPAAPAAKAGPHVHSNGTLPSQHTNGFGLARGVTVPPPAATPAAAHVPSTPAQPPPFPPHAARPVPRAEAPRPAPAPAPAQSAQRPLYGQPPPQPPRAAAAPTLRQLPPAGMSPAPGWRACWRTDAADHSGDAVTAMAYSPSYEGLPGGDGHAGWLVTASRGLLNLWECSASGGRGEASLTVMHSQAVEDSCVALAPERAANLLLSAGAHLRTGAAGVSLLAMCPEEGYLAPRGRLPLPPLPPGGGSAPPPARPPLRPLVVSLHGWGGPLAGCCAASHGPNLAVYPTATTPGEVPRAKAAWQAHSAPVTALHASAFGMQLVSGAADGSVHLWELRVKPSKPAMTWAAGGGMAATAMVSETSLVTAGGDGRALLWDTRRSGRPMGSAASPDGSGMVAMAASPLGDSVVMGTTAGGLFAVDLVDAACSVAPLTATPLPGPVAALAWNLRTGEVLAAAQACVCVFRQSY
ncbi:hypothetical protein WJX81_008395 [Elliptochloris bilobata]|uniref:Uncharacterized protein n=1 Tax=Elliptochloris bilobata TaxID=381761 RepID=A0AAW1QDC6_9CHLO